MWSRGTFCKRCRTKSIKTKPTNQVHDNSQTSSSTATANSSESYCIGHVGERKCDAIFVNVNMCDQRMKMKVDTGAKVSVIPASIFSANATWNGLILNKSEMQLSTYNGSFLLVLGEAEVTVTYGNQFVTDKIVVVQGGNHALLGRNWLLKLKLDWNSLFSNVNAIHSNESKPDILARFSAVFAIGLGTVSGHEAVINLKEGATPKCWPPNLFHSLCDKPWTLSWIVFNKKESLCPLNQLNGRVLLLLLRRRMDTFGFVQIFV